VWLVDPAKEVRHDCSTRFVWAAACLRRIPFSKGGKWLKALAAKLPLTPHTTLAEHLACLCARVADENKARDILVLDMRPITPLYDFFVLATGVSRRQTHTLAEEIDAAMQAQGESRLGIEGYEAAKWIVQDYGDILVHIFDPASREYYALEDLWADAPSIDWRRE
jgi:ribosome-associated protein